MILQGRQGSKGRAVRAQGGVGEDEDGGISSLTR